MDSAAASSAPRYDAWLSHPSVSDLSKAVGDPAPLAEARSRAFQEFLQLPLEPNPLYRKYGYFAGVDLQGIDPVQSGPKVSEPPTYPGRIQIVHDAAGTRARIPEEFSQEGVRLDSLEGIGRWDSSTLESFLRGVDHSSDRLSALALAVVNRGYVLRIPSGLRRPVFVHDYTVLSRPSEALSVRRAIEVGNESLALFDEEVFSAPSGGARQRLVSSSTDLKLGAGAWAVASTLHSPDPLAVTIYQRSASLDSGAKLAWLWTGLGGFRTKARNRTVLPGNGAEVEDLQAFYGDEDQSYDSDVTITHVGTDTRGHSITRGVFRDRSRGLSRGLVRIEKEARKTISFLSEHAMLLSRGARSDTLPILEILCRDVKATHSSSVAPVDPEKVFYLESRGLSEEQSVRTIAEGFLSHVLARGPIRGLPELVQPFLESRWARQPIAWGPASLPALPALEFSPGQGGLDWRFDAKLR